MPMDDGETNCCIQQFIGYSPNASVNERLLDPTVC